MKKSIFSPWLIRWYDWYHTYRRPRWYRENHVPRRENLCHFGRVVFLWAPLRWFFHRRLQGGLSPWMFPAAAAYALFFAAAPVVMLVITVALGLLFVWIGSNWIERTMTAGVGRVKVWHFLAAGLFALISYLSAEVVIATFIVAAVLLLIGFPILAAIYALAEVYGFLRCRIRIRSPFRVRMPRVRVSVRAPRPIRQASANIRGIFSTAWHFLVLLKRRTICPFVSFSGDRLEFIWSK